MNNSNPFIPQGSLLEQKNKKRARVKLAVYSIFAVNILVISPLLIQGCKEKPAPDTTSLMSTNAPDTNLVDTNMSTNLPPMTNLPVPTPTNTTAAAPTPTPVAAPVTESPVPPAAGTTYTVVKGDTYYSIGKKFHVGYKALEAANPTHPASKLKAGDTLDIPAASGSAATGANTLVASDTGEAVYVVKSGDSLQKIAKAHGVSLKALRSANNLKTDKIKVNQKLKIPVKASTASAAPTTDSSATTTSAAPSTVAPAAAGPMTPASAPNTTR